MTDQLTAVSTIRLRNGEESATSNALAARSEHLAEVEPRSIASTDGVLEALRSQPSRSQLRVILDFLLRGDNSESDHGFAITTPGPAASRIMAELLDTTIFDFAADENDSLRADLLRCLRSFGGINAIVAKLRFLSSQDAKSVDTHRLSVLLQDLQDILRDDDLLVQLWIQCERFQSSAATTALMHKELVSLIASGKIVSVAAQAVQKCHAHESTSTLTPICSWISDGAAYSSWLARNIRRLLIHGADCPSEALLTTTGALLTRGLAIGHPDRLISSLFHTAFAENPVLSFRRLTLLIQSLSVRDQLRFYERSIHFCTSYFHLAEIPFTIRRHDSLRKTATLLRSISDTQQAYQHLVNWASDPVRNCIEPLSARRAALSVLAVDTEYLYAVLTDNGLLFGNAMFIDHAPIVQQEACAQAILLAAALLRRTQLELVRKFARSNVLTNGTTARLGASSEQARFLGMVVCMAISKSVDPEAQRMDFKVPDVRTDRAIEYINLIDSSDLIETLDDLSELGAEPAHTGRQSIVAGQVPPGRIANPAKPSGAPMRRHKQPEQAARIIELLYDDVEGDDPVPYAKPDSDPEDEDDDPTLVNRNKPRAPVYIRDLIAGLQEKDDFDRHALALRTAASLIRRKAHLGKEVTDHQVELRTILVGLGDTFDIDNFAELRLQALIALLIADAKHVAPAYARLAFEGEYSTAQRTTVMSAIGLAARELAGYRDEDLNPAPRASFPSKKLPDRLHAVYAPGVADMAAISARMSRQMLGPLAEEALEAVSGPAALQTRQTRTFSTRMEVNKRHKIIPNEMARLLSEYFFTPLIGHYWAHTQAYGASNGVLSSPFLLATFLKTLAIMLSASGPGTLSLAALTTEFWDVLFSARTAALEKAEVLEAVLFGLLTLLEVNEDRRALAEGLSRQLVETQRWVGMVYERLTDGPGGLAPGGGTDREGDKVKMLALGVLMQLNEVVEKYQRLLMGDLFDYNVQ